MKVAVFAYSRQGCTTARKVMEFFVGSEIRAYTMERYGEEGFGAIEKPSKTFYGPIFQWADAMVFVGSIVSAVLLIVYKRKPFKKAEQPLSAGEWGHVILLNPAVWVFAFLVLLLFLSSYMV